MLPQCMDLVLLIFASNTDLKNKYQTTYIFSFILYWYSHMLKRLQG